ncbi:MAG: hypothetical protein HQL20_09060 [Candidatus Omnitrophica bacterium]|nr:hypothetical protein [Candidatus Omnitrophota bacterium]
MRKKVLILVMITMAGIFLSDVIAHKRSTEYASTYDKTMYRDIQNFTQELTQAGIPQAQIKSYSSVMLAMNRNTLSFVSSEASNAQSTVMLIAIIMLGLSCFLAGNICSQKETADV